MIRRLLVVALVLGAVSTTGCGGKRKDHSGRGQTTTTTASTVGSGMFLDHSPFNNLVGLTPASGSPLGGTAVTLDGTNFQPGMTVEFGGVAATDVVVASEVKITCKSPAHAAGLVDVVVLKGTAEFGRLNNAFNYDPNAAGVLARVADHGNPSGEEQEIVELMNRARKDPVAEAARLNAKHGTTLDFSGFAPQPALIPNEFLSQAAKAHTTDMATRGFYGHVNPDGVNANGRILDTPYKLDPTFFGDNRTINITENIGKGTGSAPGNSLTTPQGVHDTFLIDLNVVGAKHRVAMLGGGTFNNRRELGVSYLHQAPSDYIVEEFAFTTTNRPFVFGVAYTDGDADGVCRAGEGRKGVTVTLSHASGFSISTQTHDAGGFGFEVFVDGTYTLTIDGKSQQVTVAGKNIKVDLKGAALVTQ